MSDNEGLRQNVDVKHLKQYIKGLSEKAKCGVVSVVGVTMC